MSNIHKLSEQQISDRLSSDTNQTYDLPNAFSEDEYRKASVLIPFVKQDNEWHIVFIRRADSDKDRHSGQVAFVGGKAEDFDNSDIDTALRETQEEIGIDPSDVTVLGEMGSHFSLSRFQITPVVATIPWPYNLSIDPAEVSHTFTLPLAWLADESNHKIINRQPPESNEQIPVVYFNENKGELLWGATARMMLSLIKTLK